MPVLINKYVEKKLPSINENLSNSIKQKGLDPYAEVLSYEKGIGGDFLGAEASVQFSNLRGLSNIQIEELDFSEVEVHLSKKKDSIAEGTFRLAFPKELTMDIGGTIVGKAIGESISETLDGSLTNTGTTIQGEADFTVGSLRKVEIKTFHLKTLHFVMGENQVDIHGDLGVLNPLVGDIIGSITDKFNEELSGAISSALKGHIEDSVNAILPMELRG